MRRVVAFLALGLSSVPASAAVQISDYSFTATTTGLAGTQSGTFSIGFNDATNTYSLTAINYAIGSTVFDLTNAGVFFTNSGTVTVGGTAGGPIIGPFGFPIGGDMISGGIGVVQSGANDFLLNLARAPDGTLTASSFFYGQASGGTGSANAASGALSVTQLNGAVPEPATWAMMLFGFGAIGWQLRRRSSNGSARNDSSVHA